ncbi:MAG: peptidoglycan DD-metalloendopeptidase family protein [Pseudomonadota bacterium]
MAGSILTGVTSILLMGGALHAALDGRQSLADPASSSLGNAIADNQLGEKGDRPARLLALKPLNEKILQVPTVTRDGSRNVIRKRPFAYAEAPLAIEAGNIGEYPRFNPLTVFRAAEVDNQVASSDVIYGADIESEVALESVAFPYTPERYAKSTVITDGEAALSVRKALDLLEGGEVMVTALAYLDTDRFALNEAEIAPTTALDIRIVAENVSSAMQDSTETDRNFAERVVVKESDQTIEAALASLNLKAAALKRIVTPLEADLGDVATDDRLKLRVAWERMPVESASLPGVRLEKPTRIARRISVYRRGSHLASFAIDDSESVVRAEAPADIPATAADDNMPENDLRTVANAQLPRLYDGIYRAAMSQGLNADQARRIVRTVAFDVDFRQKATPEDNLEIFYSLDEGETEATDASEILFIGLTVRGQTKRYYRFKTGDDGRVGYFDENGKSSKKFLLRNPVPNAKRIGSRFGPRRHPISGRIKMHNGVDFPAVRGTKIIAAGNGVVTKIGWSGGYGRKTEIRHANGYETTYSHQHRFARGLKVGSRVRLGQIIGQIGSTGYSTGPHLHYEVKVNGRFVNPMKIRLPKGKVLKGLELAAFQQERARIDALLDRGRNGTQTVAALN